VGEERGLGGFRGCGLTNNRWGGLNGTGGELEKVTKEGGGDETPKLLARPKLVHQHFTLREGGPRGEKTRKGKRLPWDTEPIKKLRE